MVSGCSILGLLSILLELVLFFYGSPQFFALSGFIPELVCCTVTLCELSFEFFVLLLELPLVCFKHIRRHIGIVEGEPELSDLLILQLKPFLEILESGCNGVLDSTEPGINVARLWMATLLSVSDLMHALPRLAFQAVISSGQVRVRNDLAREAGSTL